MTDLDNDFIPGDALEGVVDTGGLMRNWKEGYQLIDTPKTQAASGWIGGKTRRGDATLILHQQRDRRALRHRRQAVAQSRFILITAVGQCRPSPATDRGRILPGCAAEYLPFLSEPVIGSIRLRNKTPGLELLALGSGGRVVSRQVPRYESDSMIVNLPVGQGTHWYVLKTRPPVKHPEPAKP